MLPYSSRPKMFSTCFRTIPGPLSITVIRYRDDFDAAGRSGCRSSMITVMSGSIPASSQASRLLSTASFTVVSNAFRGLSNPSRWRFLAKNSETEMSRCFAAIVSAVARGAAIFVFDMVLDESAGDMTDMLPSVAGCG